ncbi:MAG TPA: SRPBCC family protein [Longimicrobiaceae bacterium]|nr:SRPBCC family protein [Longimicrobiaceae bacterium]
MTTSTGGTQATGGASSAQDDAADREIVMTRTYDAPRALVYEVYTDPRHIGNWWGPRGFTTTTSEMDVRPGGMWRFVMHGPDGKDWGNRVVYRELVKPERIVWDHGSDVDDDPNGFHTTITFTEEEDGRTTVTQRMRFATAEQREEKVRFGAVPLGQQTLDRLGEYLAGL